MKDQKGITLTSLVIYVIVMLIVIGVMSVMINRFYNNIGQFEGNTDEIVAYNKFNTYFLKEIKKLGNKIDSITENYILFASGNSFSFADNSIYYNDMKICKNVQQMKIESKIKDNAEKIDVVTVSVEFLNFKKSMSYKLEEIY